jgi:hypothetical protein
MGSSYTALSQHLDASGQPEAIAEQSLAFQGGVGRVAPSALQLDPHAREAANLFDAILIAEQHHTRVQDGGKLPRAAVRRVRKTGSFRKVFHSRPGAPYVPGQKGGQKRFRQILDDPDLLTPDQVAVLAELSDSSDDDA